MLFTFLVILAPIHNVDCHCSCQFQISRSSNISIPDEILRKGLREEDARQGDSFAERANAGLLFGWVQGKTRVKVSHSQSVANPLMDDGCYNTTTT